MKGVYVVLNYPNEEGFKKIYTYLINHKSIDFIEIGYPFNDPVADGPVIAKAVEKVYNQVDYEKLKDVLEIPCDKKRYVMTYANIIYNYGIRRFSEDFSHHLDGVIIADLPNRMHTFFKENGFKINIVPFVTPASRKEDIEKLRDSKADFIYYIGVKGTTGTSVKDDLSLNEMRVKDIKEITDKKVVYGFGIKTKSDVEKVLTFADGMVIGTEIVKRQTDFNSMIDFIETVL